ncbi:MAG: MotA/TolQ/ExbB proton channel family protein, probably associated with flagella, partial [uncultured Microvirga sp.]
AEPNRHRARAGTHAGPRPAPDAAAALSRPHGGVPRARRLPGLHPPRGDLARLHGEPGSQRAHHRHPVHRRHPGRPAGDPVVSRGALGQPDAPAVRGRGAGRTAGAARPHGGAARQPGEPERAAGRDHPLAARFDRGPSRREPRDHPVSGRPSRVPRPSGHVLGADRHGRVCRAGDPVDARGRRIGRAVRRAEERARGAARRHGPLLFGLALRPRRLAGAGLSRPAGRPGAGPLLQRARGLAGQRHHGCERGRCGDQARLAARPGAGAEQAYRDDERGRERAGRHPGHGEPRRGHPRARPAYAGRAADDPRLGRGPGGARKGAEAGARPPVPRAGLV